MAAMTEVWLAEAWSLECHQGFPHGWQGPTTWAIFHCFLRDNGKELGQKWRQEVESNTLMQNIVVPRSGQACQSQILKSSLKSMTRCALLTSMTLFTWRGFANFWKMLPQISKFWTGENSKEPLCHPNPWWRLASYCWSKVWTWKWWDRKPEFLVFPNVRYMWNLSQ